MNCQDVLTYRTRELTPPEDSYYQPATVGQVNETENRNGELGISFSERKNEQEFDPEKSIPWFINVVFRRVEVDGIAIIYILFLLSMITQETSAFQLSSKVCIRTFS